MCAAVNKSSFDRGLDRLTRRRVFIQYQDEIDEIRLALKRERFDQVEAHLAGHSITRQLRALCDQSRMASAARHVGLFAGVLDFVTEDESGYFPTENILYQCTGSKGEPASTCRQVGSGLRP